MKKINVLDSYIYNRISAGEVVERPSSVVKELVENAIDAGATSIDVEISNGGIERICVTDNGYGIEKDDFNSVFLPHATSKISNVEDLDNIATLGFRGEAMASIAAVSRVKLKSRTLNSDCACVMEISDRESSQITFAASNVGTTVEVNNLFYNTPARAKYLKKPKSEENAITQLMVKLIISNNNIRFKYIVDGKLVYTSNANGLMSAIKSVYPIELYSNLIDVDLTSSDGISIKGYISVPKYTKNTKVYQLLCVNGRIINNLSAQTAIYKGYRDMLLKGTHPVYFLSCTLDYDKLDVNVTPNKSDVRFFSADSVFSSLYHAVNARLEKFYKDELSKSYDEVLNSEINNDSKINSNIANENFNHNETIEDTYISRLKDLYDSSSTTISLRESSNNKTYLNNNDDNIEDKNNVEYDEHSNIWKSTTNNSIKNTLYSSNFEIDKIDNNINNVNSKNNATVINDKLLPLKYKIAGYIFNMFLVIELENKILLIDVHAANERLTYDDLISEMDNNAVIVQPLLIPYIVNLQYDDYMTILRLKNEFYNVGIELADFGDGAIKVEAVPMLLKDIDLNSFFSTVTSELKLRGDIKSSDLFRHKLATIACKTSIKAGDSMTVEQQELMAKRLLIDNKLPLQCPHGRPVFIEVSKSKIEQLFKRI